MQMENARDWDLISVLANCIYFFECRSTLVPLYYVKGYKLQLSIIFSNVIVPFTHCFNSTQ